MSKVYDKNKIKILSGFDSIRKRPGMFIGSTGINGLYNLLYQILNNCVNEAVCGFCDEIEIKIYSNNSISIKDNGRGISPEAFYKDNMSLVETVFTIPFYERKYKSIDYKYLGNIYNDSSVVNALSEWLSVNIFYNGSIYWQKYIYGQTATKLTAIGKTLKRGMHIHFKPDNKIFKENIIDFNFLKFRFQQIAFLIKGLKISVYDMRKRTKQKYVFYSKDGINDFVNYINKDKVLLYDQVFYIYGQKTDMSIEIAFQHINQPLGHIYSFVNNFETINGGTHVEGFKSAFLKALSDFGKNTGMLSQSNKYFIKSDIFNNITAVINIWIINPFFCGATKEKLGNPDIKYITEAIVYKNLIELFKKNFYAVRVIFNNYGIYQ